LNLSAGLVIDL